MMALTAINWLHNKDPKMSKICPETGEKVIYMVCQECEDKAECRRRKAENRHYKFKD